MTFNFRTLLSEVQKGASPDTEVLFSKHILFKAAVDHISKHIGTDIVATGHYARNIAASEGEFSDFLENSALYKAQTLAKLLTNIKPQKDYRGYIFSVPEYPVISVFQFES